jgi:hypothetical protein
MAMPRRDTTREFWRSLKVFHLPTVGRSTQWMERARSDGSTDVPMESRRSGLEVDPDPAC